MTTRILYGGLVGEITDDGVIRYGGLVGQLTGDLEDGTFLLGGLLGRIVGGTVYYGGLVGTLQDGVLRFGGLVGEVEGGAPEPEFISAGTAVRWNTFEGPKLLGMPPVFAAGDLLLAWTGGAEAANQNTPAGFTLLSSALAGPLYAAMYGKIATGLEVAFNYDPNGLSQGAAVILAFRNMAASIPALAPQVVAPGLVLDVPAFRTAAITPGFDKMLVVTATSKSVSNPLAVATALAGATVVPMPSPSAAGLTYALAWVIQDAATPLAEQDFTAAQAPGTAYQAPMAVALKSVLS